MLLELSFVCDDLITQPLMLIYSGGAFTFNISYCVSNFVYRSTQLYLKYNFPGHSLALIYSSEGFCPRNAKLFKITSVGVLLKRI